MLFQYSLKNRWIKAALTITELQVPPPLISAVRQFSAVGKLRVAHRYLLRHRHLSATATLTTPTSSTSPRR